jgi:short-subunit dehydrogenase
VVNGSLIALPMLKQSGGALINVGSELSDAVVPLQGMYVASKHAVKAFTDALRLELEEIDHANVAITLVMPTVVDTPYPQHAKNYLAQEPKLPEPQLDPQVVADAILEAATRHRREVKVGTASHVHSFISRLVPSLADAMSAKQVDEQQYAEPPRNPEGTLQKPGGEGRIKGTGGRHARRVISRRSPSPT